MVSYFAYIAGDSFSGGFSQCLTWGRQQSTENTRAVIKIFKARAGEKNARLIGEIIDDNYHPTTSHQYRATKKLRGKHG